MYGVPENWITLEQLGSFSGLVLFVAIATAFFKEPFKKKWGDCATRAVAMGIAFLTQFFYIAVMSNISLESVGLALVNSVAVAAAACGTYEFIADPRAIKINPMKIHALPHRKNGEGISNQF